MRTAVLCFAILALAFFSLSFTGAIPAFGSHAVARQRRACENFLADGFVAHINEAYGSQLDACMARASHDARFVSAWLDVKETAADARRICRYEANVERRLLDRFASSTEEDYGPAAPSAECLATELNRQH